MTLPAAYQVALDARRKAIHDARQHITFMEAELRGFEAAAAFLAHAAPVNEPSDGSGLDQRNGIRGTWRAILAATADTYPKPTSLDDFQQIAEGLGTPTTRNTLRSQMSIYSNGGYLERVGQGEYRLTVKGAEMLGVTLGHQSADAEPDNGAGNSTPGPNGEDHHEPEGGEAMNRADHHPEV